MMFTYTGVVLSKKNSAIKQISNNEEDCCHSDVSQTGVVLSVRHSTNQTKDLTMKWIVTTVMVPYTGVVLRETLNKSNQISYNEMDCCYSDVPPTAMVLSDRHSANNIIRVIIAFQGTILDLFYNFLTAPRTVSNMYTQVAQAQSCANHVQHIERLSRATCYMPRGTKGQLSY